MRPFVVLFVLLAVACSGSGGSDGPTAPLEGALFAVRACRGSDPAPGGELFRVLMRDPRAIAEASRLLATGEIAILEGALLRGNGGFNQPWSWHLDPDDVNFPQPTVEVCDGCPSFVENDLETWLGLGQFCPWTAEVVSRIQ